jgi:prevent-host-death family protein
VRLPIAPDSIVCYPLPVSKSISQAELRNGSARVMDAVEAGEDFIVTRNGAPVAELRPLSPRRELSADELIAMFAGLSPGSSGDDMRAEADAIFGEDRIGDE